MTNEKLHEIVREALYAAAIWGWRQRELFDLLPPPSIRNLKQSMVETIVRRIELVYSEPLKVCELLVEESEHCFICGGGYEGNPEACAPNCAYGRAKAVLRERARDSRRSNKMKTCYNCEFAEYHPAQPGDQLHGDAPEGAWFGCTVLDVGIEAAEVDSALANDEGFECEFWAFQQEDSVRDGGYEDGVLGEG